MFNTGLISPRHRRGEISLIFLLFIIGCTNIEHKLNIPLEKNASVFVYFCAEDNCSEQFYRFIDSAKYYVHCSLYNIADDKIISLLSAKSKVIDVKIFVDKKNYKNQLGGENIRLSRRTNHNKFCVADANRVITGSFNPTKKEIMNNNNLIIFYSRLIAKNYEDEFKEQWHGLKETSTANKEIILKNKKFINLFCPDDNCIQYYLEALTNANKSIYFMSYSLTNEDIADTLIMKKADIKGILESSQAKNRYSQYERLKGFGLNVKLYKAGITLHHKVFIIDNSTVITGSINPTNNGFFNNDENMLIIYDREIAKKYLIEFDRLFKG